MEFAKDQIYRVRSDEDPTALIALDVQVQGDHLTWFDSNRDRGHRIKECDDAKFVTDGGFTYTFEPLTKEIYDTEVRTQVELSPEFGDTDELRKFYLTNFLGMEV